MISLDSNDDGDAYIDTPVRRRIEPQRVMLILTRSASVSDRLIEAVEREFPRIIVEQVDHVGAACARFSHPVALILVDFALVKEAEAEASGLQRMHPDALTAVIQPNDNLAALAGITVSPFIRSILPMDLRLDVWLSIIRLMLCGGEYFPPGIAIQPAAGNHGSKMALQESTGYFSQGRERSLAELTVRETQILAKAALGLQNKLIAAEFRLSEHTVKVHLHNIIRKLGVHNRTEAAARFRNAAAPIGYE